VNEARDESEAFFSSLFSGENIGEYSGHNDEVDAFRHAYVSAIIAYERDEETAAALGWAHEAFNTLRGQPHDQWNMDSVNNREGRSTAAGIAPNALNYKALIAADIASKLSNGDLVVIAPHFATSSGATEDTVSEQIDKAHAENYANMLDEYRPDWESEQDPIIPTDPTRGLLDWLGDALTPFSASPPPSPLVVDLDSDGVELTAFNAATTETFFDVDGDGFAEQTAWVDADDGLLARDINENGKIDDVTELFGSPNIDGFALLALLDTNGDLAISSFDDAWDELVVWQDADGDAETDEGELLTLTSLNIVSIDLASVLPSSSTINGNPISHTSTFRYANGSTDDIADAWFVLDQANSFYTGGYELDVQALFLPKLRGFGEVADLHIAMSQNGDLLGMIDEFVDAFSFESFADEVSLDDALSDILYEWAGVQDDTPYMIHGVLDSRQRAFLEAFFGREYATTYLSLGSAENLKMSWDTVLGHAKAQLLVQMGAATLFDGDVIYDPWAGEITGDTTLSQTEIDALVPFATDTGVDTEAYWVAVGRFLQFAKGGFAEFSGTEEGWLDDAIYESDPLLDWEGIVDIIEADLGGLTLNGTSSGETINGSIGADTLSGLGGNDTLNGGDGNDTLWGGDGDDTLNPGTGGNTVYGGYGDDIYNYGGGDDFYGEYNAGGTDEIRLPSGITSGDVTIEGVGADDLIIHIDGQGSIQIDRQFYYSPSYSTAFMINTLRYNDNSTQSLTSLSTLTINGTENDDASATALLWNLGLSWDLTIFGHGGADTIYGDAGEDVIDGGDGNDTVTGKGGNDTYVASAGYDTITEDGYTDSGDILYIPAAYGASDVTLWRDGTTGYDLNIVITGLGQINVDNHFYNTNWGIEDIVFENSDPSIDLQTVSIISIGTSGNDTVSGVYYNGSNADILDGRDGNDTLNGSSGNDTYIVSAGNDVTGESDGTDKILFVDDNELGDVDLWRSTALYNDLLIDHLYGQLKVTNQFYWSTGGQIETLELADTTTLTLTSHVIETRGTSGNDSASGIEYGASPNDIMYGYGGNDTLQGAGGNDYLDGGSGNDSLDGGAGDDVFAYSEGLDTVTDSTSGADTLLLLHSVTINDISFSNVSAYHTKLTITASTDEITINWLRHWQTSGHIERIKFADGFETSLPDYASWINGTSSGETVSGTSGDDTLVAMAGNDTVNAGSGNDDAHGGSGDDTLNGGNGTDLLHGGVGDDVLYGQDGLDTLFGGTGADDFIFEAANAFNNGDVIKDFVANDNDAIDISDVLDTHYTHGVDVLTNFVQITTNGSNSELRVDTTGSASFGGGTLIATIEGVTGLTDEAALVTAGRLLVA
jgi:Ca2+-binding RTX toxin-like protein